MKLVLHGARSMIWLSIPAGLCSPFRFMISASYCQIIPKIAAPVEAIFQGLL